MKRKFNGEDKVKLLNSTKIYDFGYYSQTEGKVVIYDEGECSMQDSYAVDINNLELVEQNPVSTKQPKSTPGDKNVAPYVIADMQARVGMGLKKHGTYLQTNNGRDALMDAYQKALDLVMYLRQVIMERDDAK